MPATTDGYAEHGARSSDARAGRTAREIPPPAPRDAAALAGSDWSSVGQRRGVRVYHRSGAGTGIRDVMARLVFDAPLARVAAVLRDYDAYTAASRELGTSGRHGRVYQCLDFAALFPLLRRRCYVIRVDIRTPGGANGHVRIG